MNNSIGFSASSRWGLVLVMLLCVVTQAHADLKGNVLSPGPVIKQHARFESDCGNCHKRFDKAAQPEMCRSCHNEIAQDESTKRGLHGQHVEKTACKECHQEHKGRDVSLYKIDTTTFDHAKETRYELKGGHLSGKVTCKNCHFPRKKFRDVSKTCNGCHAGKDKHKELLGKTCQSCHEEKSWKTLHFNHGKTRFKVLGKHIGVKCSACHRDATFKNAPRECNQCHRKDDKHKGNYGAKCETCHTDRDWKEILFDHGKATKYPLLGKHHEAKCESCHKGALYKSKPKLKTDCYSCHKKEDKHKGQQGKKCESCHTPHSWKKSKFDHRMSRFALTGLHTLVACNKCHVTVAFKDAKSDCLSCHEKEDVHMRRLGVDCETCHNTRNWRDWDFNHNKTGFKLQHSHAGLQCIDCHATPVDKIGRSTGCGTCHSNVDTHNGAYGDKCGQCHSDTAWRNIKIGSLKFNSRERGSVQTDKTVSTKQKSGKKKVKKKTRSRQP
jgi:hypothetical protein